MTTIRSTLLPAWLLVLLALLAACAADAPAPDSEVVTFYRRLAQAYADLVTRCCERVELRSIADPEGFAESYIAEHPSPASGAVFNPEQGELCIAAVERAGCTLAKDPVPSLPECFDIHPGGNLAIGSVCVSSYECAWSIDQPTACVGSTENGRTVSRCRRDIVRAAGESCASREVDDLSTVSCAEPTRCDFRTVTCQPRPERGEACEVTNGRGDTCAHGSVCDRSDTGLCVAPKAWGEACIDDEECEGFKCFYGKCREPLFEISEWDCVP